jgi:hypothetical protein
MSTVTIYWGGTGLDDGKSGKRKTDYNAPCSINPTMGMSPAALQYLPVFLQQILLKYCFSFNVKI